MFCIRSFNFHKIFQILLNFKLTTNSYSKVYILYTLSGHNCMFPPFISFSCTHVQKDQLGPTLDVNGSCQIGANTQNFVNFEYFKILAFGTLKNLSKFQNFWDLVKIHHFCLIFGLRPRFFSLYFRLCLEFLIINNFLTKNFHKDLKMKMFNNEDGLKFDRVF